MDSRTKLLHQFTALVRCSLAPPVAAERPPAKPASLAYGTDRGVAEPSVSPAHRAGSNESTSLRSAFRTSAGARCGQAQEPPTTRLDI